MKPTASRGTDTDIRHGADEAGRDGAASDEDGGWTEEAGSAGDEADEDEAEAAVGDERSGAEDDATWGAGASGSSVSPGSGGVVGGAGSGVAEDCCMLGGNVRGRVLGGEQEVKGQRCEEGGR